MSSRRVIRILGREYPVRGDVDGNYLRELESFVESVADRISKEARSVDTISLMALLVLNISGDLLRERKDWSKKEERIKKLISLIEDELGSSNPCA